MKRRAIHLDTFPPDSIHAVVDQLSEQGGWFRVEAEGVPYPVILWLAKAVDGRLVCRGLLAGAPDPRGPQPPRGLPNWLDMPGPGPYEVTARSLRQIPLLELLMRRVATDTNEELSLLLGEPVNDGPSPAPRARPGPRGWPTEHFEKVAARYRAALIRTPRTPLKTLADEWPTSKATAARWLQRCRDMGLLGEATPGRAGEQPLPKGGPS